MSVFHPYTFILLIKERNVVVLYNYAVCLQFKKKKKLVLAKRQP